MDNVFEFTDAVINLPDYEEQAVHTQYLPARTAKLGKLDSAPHPVLQAKLSSLGIETLYSHQARAINLVLAGKNVIISTPSASGKSLCYNIPVLETILAQPVTRALCLFPTKALAQDQLRRFHQLSNPEILKQGEYATFDGDTPSEDRAVIKNHAKVILTNPDMLHLGILPNHQAWSRFIKRLRFVILDEAHIYRGVFGSHVANVFRRLNRLCRLYGSNPQFILSSATIANPGELAGQLTGQHFEVVDNDGSPQGARRFVFWNPPLTDEVKATRRSPNTESTYLFSELVKRGIRTIVFARTRKLTELIFRYTRNRLPHSLSDSIQPYRAGYLAEDRRRIERGLFSGELCGVVSTTALELGINIGDLEATILTGYPGSISSTWQQAGRSGRDGRNSLSVLIACNDPLDQYLMRHPDFFFSRNFESALINPDNPQILKPHLLCAAWEKPLNAADKDVFGEYFETLVTELESLGKLVKRGHLWFPSTSVTYPAQDINIRSSSHVNYALVDSSRGYRLLETVPASLAFSQLHEGAVYFHQGESYLITGLDLDTMTATAEPANVPYYTVARELTDISILSTSKVRSEMGVQVSLGEVEVTSMVIGYKKKRQYTEEALDEHPLDLPPQRFETQAVWFDLPPRGLEKVNAAGLDLAGGLHALEHAAIGVLPLFALCDRNDIGGVSTTSQSQTGKPQVFIYDAHAGGIGIAEKGYYVIRDLWRVTLRAISECPCQDGCPACVQSPKCGNNNEPLDKEAAAILLKSLIAPPDDAG